MIFKCLMTVKKALQTPMSKAFSFDKRHLIWALYSLFFSIIKLWRRLCFLAEALTQCCLRCLPTRHNSLHLFDAVSSGNEINCYLCVNTKHPVLLSVWHISILHEEVHTFGLPLCCVKGWQLLLVCSPLFAIKSSPRKWTGACSGDISEFYKICARNESAEWDMSH